MRKRYSNQEKEDKKDVDLTPMLDVVFIMLIFFIITSTFIAKNALDIKQTDSNPNNPPPSTSKPPILITIDEHNRIFLDHKEIEILSVRSNVARIHSQSSRSSVVIKPDDSSKTDTILRVLDQVRETGLSTVFK